MFRVRQWNESGCGQFSETLVCSTQHPPLVTPKLSVATIKHMHAEISIAPSPDTVMVELKSSAEVSVTIQNQVFTLNDQFQSVYVGPSTNLTLDARSPSAVVLEARSLASRDGAKSDYSEAFPIALKPPPVIEAPKPVVEIKPSEPAPVDRKLLLIGGAVMVFAIVFALLFV